MTEGYAELLQLVAGLPSDFARVGEAFNALRSTILASFRAEDRPAGEVIDDYLRRADSLVTATAEGRAFEGAFTLLRDDALLLQLREDLTALLSHPLAEDILMAVDRRDLKGTVSLIRHGIEDVLVQRNRVTAALRDYIVTHDVTRDRELDGTLRQLDAELATWMQTAGPRAAVPIRMLPLRAGVTHLRERFHDSAPNTTPPPLHEPDGDKPEALSLAELLLQGGPTFDALREALTGGAPVASLGALFDRLDPALRRPVEIFGLLQLGINRPDLRRHDDTEVYRTVRPDGTPRPFAVPRVAPAAYPTAPEPSTPLAAAAVDSEGHP